MKSCEMKRLERNRNEWNFLMETGVRVLPFLESPPCGSLWVLACRLMLGFLSFWSSLSTRWMMHSRDLSTFDHTFSWKTGDASLLSKEVLL